MTLDNGSVASAFRGTDIKETSLKRSALVVPGLAAVLAAAIVAFVGPFHSPVTRAASSLEFEATFETSADFYDRFDYGFSGFSPLNTPGAQPVTEFHGDHNDACAGPDTDRTVQYSQNGDELDYSQVFWHCAPGGDPTKGHVMTGVDTVGYNTAWFAPRQMFTNVTQVCWDINETAMSSRKWTQVLFVSPDDATRYPSDRGTGGFDLGYTSPEFRQDAPNNGIFPEGGTLAGLKDEGGTFNWFDHQDQWASVNGDTFFGWPGHPKTNDKAARYTHCLANQPDNVVRLTQDTVDGTRTIDMPGQIPSGPVRVVFEDDNYDPRKDEERYDANVLTWHWDNIQVHADASAEVAQVAPPAAPAARAADGQSADGQVATEQAAPASSGILEGHGGRARRVAPAVALAGALALVIAALVVVAVLQQRRSTRGVPPDTTDPTHD